MVVLGGLAFRMSEVHLQAAWLRVQGVGIMCKIPDFGFRVRSGVYNPVEVRYGLGFGVAGAG